MSELLISILHPTVRPSAWKTSADNWFRNCDRPENVEYVLVTEKAEFPSLDNLGIPFQNQIAAHNQNSATAIGGFNYAAQISHGKVMITTGDDFYSAPHWDTDLLKVLEGKLDQEVVVQANTDIPGFDDNFISLPILTRAYLLRCGNYIFWPEYTSYYADVEFTEVAKLNGVEIINARNVLRFRHIRGGLDGSFQYDEAYKKNVQTGEFCGALFSKRQAAGFPR